MSKIELIDFYAPWCGPCTAMAAIIADIEKTYDGKIRITKINIDEKPEEAQKYNVMSMPTFLLKKDGVVQKQLLGMQSKENIEKALDKLLA